MYDPVGSSFVCTFIDSCMLGQGLGIIIATHSYYLDIITFVQGLNLYLSVFGDIL